MLETINHKLSRGILNHLVHIYNKKGVGKLNKCGGVTVKLPSYCFDIYSTSEVRLWKSITFDGGNHSLKLELKTQDLSVEPLKQEIDNIINFLVNDDLDIGNDFVIIEGQHEKTEILKIGDDNRVIAHIYFTFLTVLS